MVAWGSLVRRLAWILAPVVLRHLRRLGGTARPGPGPDGGASDADGTVIDVEAVGAFDRFDDATRRAVVRAAEEAGGAGFTADALLLGLADTWPALAQTLEDGEPGLAGLHARLEGGLMAGTGDGPGADARRVLEQAVARADRRGRFQAGRRDLLAALLDPAVGLTRRLDAPTLEALGRI